MSPLSLKTVVTTILLCVAITTLLLSIIPLSTAQSASTTVSGVVRIDGIAMNGIQVTCNGQTQLSKEGGAYSFTVPVGVTMTVSATYHGITVSSDPFVSSGPTTHNIDIVTMGALGGYVFFNDQPAVGALVTAAGQTEETDADGYFIVNAWAGNSYNINVSYNGNNQTFGPYSIGPGEVKMVELRLTAAQPSPSPVPSPSPSPSPTPSQVTEPSPTIEPTPEITPTPTPTPAASTNTNVLCCPAPLPIPGYDTVAAGAGLFLAACLYLRNRKDG